MSRLVSEDLSEVSSDDQFPRRRKACSAFRWKQNWKCALLTGLVCSCLLAAILYYRQRSDINRVSVEAAANRSGSSRNAYWILIFCGVISYSLYLMECSYATDRIELCDRKTQHTSHICEQIERMKSAQPIIWWKATCYHYARRKIRTTRFRRGTYFVSTKVYQERVNSFTSSSTFNYDSCGVKDISNNLVMGENCAALVKFRFSKGFAFLNTASAIEFEDQRSTFFRELRRYDDYMDIQEGLDLTDCASFNEEVLALNAPPGTKPWFADPFYYWLCSCFLLSWPFRLVLAYNTAYVHYKVTKLFGTNYADFTDSTQQLALFQFYEMRMRDSSGGGGCGGDSSVTATPVWSNVVTPDDEYDGRRRVRGAGSAELAPTYSEALLLLDHDDAAAACAEAPDAACSLIHIPAPATYSTATVVAAAATLASSAVRRPNAAAEDEDAGEDDVFAAVAAFSAENPPSYEEALGFPVVETVAAATDSPVSRFSANVNSPDRRNRCDTRLPNPRTFLSIETSL